MTRGENSILERRKTVGAGLVFVWCIVLGITLLLGGCFVYYVADFVGRQTKQKDFFDVFGIDPPKNERERKAAKPRVRRVLGDLSREKGDVLKTSWACAATDPDPKDPTWLEILDAEEEVEKRYERARSLASLFDMLNT